MEKKFMDLMAALCLTFNVDWTQDFADDEYCLDNRPVITAAPKQTAPKKPAVIVGRAG